MQKLFWPYIVWINCSSDREKLFQFEAEDREFPKKNSHNRSKQFWKQNTISILSAFLCHEVMRAGNVIKRKKEKEKRKRRRKKKADPWFDFLFYFVFPQSNLAVLSPLHFSCWYTTIPLNTLIQLAIKWNPHFFNANLDSNKCEILLCFSSWFLSQVTRLVLNIMYFGTKLSTYEWTHALEIVDIK